MTQRVDGVDTRLKTAEGGLAETGQVARGARERADGAFTISRGQKNPSGQP